MLGVLSQRVKSKIGSSIINIYSRSPALTAMGAVTIDSISNGRLVLGLGTSSPPIIENLHGYRFQRPLSRMREYVEVVRKAASGQKISHDGEFFKLRGFSLLIKPARDSIPIYLAAVNEGMLRLSWEIADGVILYLRPINEMKRTINKMQSKRKIDAACQIITAVSDDGEKAIKRAKTTIAFYVSVGKIYRDFLAENGFRNETKNIHDEFAGTGESRAELVPDAMADALTIHGTPEECRKKLEKFTDAGIDLPIIQFNPIGNVHESFMQVTSAFSGDGE